MGNAVHDIAAMQRHLEGTLQQPEPERMLWTYAKAAEQLELSERTLKRLVADDKIPYVSIGDRNIRFDPVALRQWINEKQSRN